MNKVLIVTSFVIFCIGCTTFRSDNFDASKSEKILELPKKIKLKLSVECFLTKNHGKKAETSECTEEFRESFKISGDLIFDLVDSDSSEYDAVLNLKYIRDNNDQEKGTVLDGLFYTILPLSKKLIRKMDWNFEFNRGVNLILHKEHSYNKYAFFLFFPVGLYQIAYGSQNKMFEALNFDLVQEFVKTSEYQNFIKPK